MKKILVILTTALLVCFLPNAVFGQVPAVRSAIRSAAKATRVKPVRIPHIAVPQVPKTPPGGYRLVGPKPPVPSMLPRIAIPYILAKGINLPDTANNDFTRQYYVTMRKSIEAGERDTVPSALLWAGDYALGKGDTAFFESCFEKAMSPRLTVEVMEPFIRQRLSHCRERIPQLLQYMAERDFLSLVDSISFTPDSVRQFRSRIMSEWAADYYPELQPLTRLYYCDGLSAFDLDMLLRQALSAHADSAATYSDATVGLLLDSYINNAYYLRFERLNNNFEPEKERLEICFSMCRRPRLSPFVESDIQRVSALAALAARIASEDYFYHCRDIARTLSPETYGQLREQLVYDISWTFGGIIDNGPEADRARFRMVADTSADPASDLGNMITKAYADILSNIWAYSHMPYMKYIKECPRCTRRMEAIVATIDDMANYVPDTEYAYDDQLWGERTAHYMRFILDPSQSAHIDEVEKILSQIKKSDIESKDDMILETAVILADMKGRTDANPALAVKTLKPYGKLADSEKVDPLYKKYYYEYLLLLYDITGDIKNRDKVAKKLEKINEAFA